MLAYLLREVINISVFFLLILSVGQGMIELFISLVVVIIYCRVWRRLTFLLLGYGQEADRLDGESRAGTDQEK